MEAEGSIFGRSSKTPVIVYWLGVVHFKRFTQWVGGAKEGGSHRAADDQGMDMCSGRWQGCLREIELNMDRKAGSQ
jgi:hypothetical protein